MKPSSEGLHWIPACAGMTQVQVSASREDALSPYANKHIPKFTCVEDEAVESAASVHANFEELGV